MYLGETKINKAKSEKEWAMLWIEMYSGIDGSHHKDWLLDQIARILNGTKVISNIAKWDDGNQEERFKLDDPPEQYWKWVEKMKDGEYGPETYTYEFGIAP